eukprot:14733067-Alexandrium_andersonii.AAC.1
MAVAISGGGGSAMAAVIEVVAKVDGSCSCFPDGSGHGGGESWGSGNGGSAMGVAVVVVAKVDGLQWQLFSPWQWRWWWR